MADQAESDKVLEVAKSHIRERQFATAIKLLTPAVESDKDNADLHECLATVCFLKGDLDRALEEFKHVTRLKPLKGTAWINIGAVHNRLGNHRDAVAALRKGLAREKRSAQGYYNLGIAQKGLNQLAMAATAYKEAIKLNPQMAEAHQNLGNIYLDMANNRQAVNCFKKALEIKPDFDRAQRGLAIAENAISDGRKNDNPFGRLVSKEDLAAQKGTENFKELSDRERYEDRHLIRSLTGGVREQAHELADHYKNQLEPVLLSLSRSVSGAGSGKELAGAFEKFLDAVKAAGAIHSQMREGMSSLREHEQELRES